MYVHLPNLYLCISKEKHIQSTNNATSFPERVISSRSLIVSQEWHISVSWVKEGKEIASWLMWS